MSPQPYFDQGEEYFCSHNCIDVEQYQDPCGEFEDDYENCGQCPYCEKQSYRIVVQDPKFKEFI